jgi:hypothetical protein
MHYHRLILSVLALTACTPKAPEEIDALTGYLYREWDNPDSLIMLDGLSSLERLLEAKMLGPNGAGNDRLLQLAPIKVSDITVTPWPMDRDPARTIGTLVIRESKWPVIDHARVQADPDQLAVEPSAAMYTRTYLEPTDPTCLIDASCTTLRTSNDITRSNATLKVTYTLLKTFRWFTLADGRKALVARGWAPMSYSGESGAINLSFSLDIFLPRPGDVTWRYQCSFSENQLTIATTDDLQVAVVTGAVDEALRKADDVIGQRYHGL